MEVVNTKESVCAGVDIGKSTLFFALAEGGKPSQCANTVEGRAQLIAFLKRHRVRRVGMEASGGYEIEVADDLSGGIQGGGFAVELVGNLEIGHDAVRIQKRVSVPAACGRITSHLPAGAGHLRLGGRESR